MADTSPAGEIVAAYQTDGPSVEIGAVIGSSAFKAFARNVGGSLGKEITRSPVRNPPPAPLTRPFRKDAKPGKIRDMAQTLGEDFARAVAAKDHARVRELLHPDLDFRAMTPNRVWEASEPEQVLGALCAWFDDGDDIESLAALETDAFADRERVGYRLRVRNGDGIHLVEQQAYLSTRDGRIGWLRIMCSGYRPVD